jgi:hypothetical protein
MCDVVRDTLSNLRYPPAALSRRICPKFTKKSAFLSPLLHGAQPGVCGVGSCEVFLPYFEDGLRFRERKLLFSFWTGHAVSGDAEKRSCSARLIVSVPLVEGLAAITTSVSRRLLDHSQSQTEVCSLAVSSGRRW